jgi:exodeoxyribonuclease VII large subunit
VGHEIDWALCDFAADLRAPTPSAAAELVSENFCAVQDAIRTMGEGLKNVIRTRLERTRLLLKPFDPHDLEYRFRAILQPRLIRFDDAKDELIDAISEKCIRLRNRIALAGAVIEAGSPLAAMERGFSVVTDNAGKVVTNSAKVKKGDKLMIRPLKGTIHAVAEKIN